MLAWCSKLTIKPREDKMTMFGSTPVHTPMMQQYLQIKQEYPDTLLLYRLGDFYELFYDDAKLASELLNITLTARGQSGGQPVPMCGVPVHSYLGYVKRLLDGGHRVAMCEQTELPSKNQKAPLKREVVRVMTPGTLMEEELLGQDPNYLAVLCHNTKENVTLGLCDLSTGEMILQTFDHGHLRTALTQYNPAEIVVPESLYQAYESCLSMYRRKLVIWPDSRFDVQNAKRHLQKQFQGLLLEVESEAVACGILIDYLYLTQKTQTLNLQRPRLHQISQYMRIDASTFRNLEIIETLSGKKEGSLYGFLNQTRTAQGGRLLKERLAMPLIDKGLIDERLQEVEFFHKHDDMRTSTRDILAHMPDLERCLTRIAMGKAQPKELGQVQKALHCMDKLKPLLVNCELAGFDVLRATLDRALSDVLGLKNFVKSAFSDALDEQREFRDKGRQMMEDLQAKYRQQMACSTLRIKENGVLGYFIELSRSYLDKVPKSFHIKQTLVNAIRCTTDDLKDLAEKIIFADQHASDIEGQIFDDLCGQVLSIKDSLLHISSVIARIDVASTLAEIARCNNYVKPCVDEGFDMEIMHGRHPTCEQTVDFVPNDLLIEQSTCFQLITGPNMGGKSTYLRQTALIVLMGQTGSFVPATSAHIGIIDQLFSRIGAQDDLYAGQSTFMVEMSEVSYILNHASSRSLVILDEVGRGTATYDGLAIAWAVSDYLLNTVQTKTLFATHYHELTQLVGVHNKTVQVEEQDGQVKFFHKIIDGKAYKSYGIQVAQVAGLPDIVLAKARHKLAEMEAVFKFDLRKVG